MVIETVTLRAADVVALQTFYERGLGLSAVLDGEGKRLTIAVGWSTLVFQQEADFTGRYHFAFNVPKNRLNAAYAYLAAREIALIADAEGNTFFDFDFWDAHAIYFYDPAGNIVEFIARHELPNALRDAEDLPFAPAEAQCISEIGLPVMDVPLLSDLLAKSVNAAPYKDASPTFMPVGDANGLFILVPAGRIWFPDTGIAAELLPVQAIMRNNAGKRFVVEGVPYRVSPL